MKKPGLAASITALATLPCLAVSLVTVLWHGQREASAVHGRMQSEANRIAEVWSMFPGDREAIAAIAAAQGFQIGPPQRDHPIDVLHQRVGSRIDDIVVSHDLVDERQVMRRTILELLFLFCGSALWMTGVAAFVGIRFIRDPIDALIRRAQDIASGDFASAPALRGPAEAGRLAVALDDMAATLQRSREQAAAAELRRRDDERRWMRSERLATVGRLAAGLTHELGTPLNVILVEAESIIDGESPAEHAELIVSQVERIRSLTRGLLRLSAPQPPAGGSTTEVDTVIDESVRMLASLARKAGVDLVTDLQAGARVAIPPAEVTQIVINLVVNAIHACEAGPLGRRKVVTVTTGVMGDDRPSVTITVADTGTGIPAQDVERVFDPFFTTKDPGKGTGLGLAIVDAIVTDAGGRHTVQSDQSGTKVVIALPCPDTVRA